ncbi:MAG: GTPase ObgE [bacterium]|nr:GTPase ObgE [bacterium]
MLVDEVEITIKAGNGGNGKVGFLRSKFVPKGGPSGGDGGRGGDIYLEGVGDIGALNRFRNQKYFAAEDGEGGGLRKKTGKDGESITLKLPVGSIVSEKETRLIYEITQEGEIFLIAKGGKGGKGNWRFRSPTNQAPRYAEPGKRSPERKLHIELKLIANVGLVGLPNGGKTSLLNELTNASAKVANYPFTTLEPNLGVMGNLILADIPGLIEGAAEGKGLGYRFLRHIQRTKVLAHCISSESENLEKDYKIIRSELGKFNKELLEKKEILVLTKSDLISEKDKKEKLKVLKKFNKNVISVSIHDLDSLKSFQKLVLKTLND